MKYVQQELKKFREYPRAFFTSALVILFGVFATAAHAVTLTATTLNVQSPINGATVSGTVAITGQAGSTWVNLAVYNAAGSKISSDVKPANGSYSAMVDTTKLPTGSSTLKVIAFSVPAGQAGGTSATATITLNVQQVATLPPTTLNVQSPSSGAMVAGTVTIKGQAGSTWVNLAVYDAAGNKISSDVKPSNGSYSAVVDTTKLANGATTLSVIAFSVPAGQSGGTSASTTITLNVQQVVTLPSTTLNVQSPTNGAMVSGSVSIQGQAGSTWVNLAVYDVAGNKISSDVKPANGSYSAPIDTTKLPNGTMTLSVIAFSVPAGQSGGTSATASINLNLQNSTTPAPGVVGFGKMLGGNATKADLPRLAAIGMKWARMDFPDAATITYARTLGIEILPILDYGYTDLSGSSNWMAPPLPQNYGIWAQRKIDQYRAMANPPKVFEIWNEPWGNNFWGGNPDPAAYLALFKVTAQQIWAVWPNAIVLVSADTGEISYRQRLLAADTTGFLNDRRILPTVHPYVGARTPTTVTSSPCAWDLNRYECAYNEFRAHGHPNPQVWVTEYGWESNTPSPGYSLYGAVTEQQQSDYTIQSLEMMRTSGHVAATFYYETIVGDPWNYNIFRPDGSNKPIVGALQNYIASHP